MLIIISIEACGETAESHDKDKIVYSTVPVVSELWGTYDAKIYTVRIIIDVLSLLVG